MSTLSKKLFISVLTLILTVGAFTATTFAWFSLGNVATVGQFQGQVQSAEGLDIRIKTGDSTWSPWANNLSSTVVNNAIVANLNSGVTSLALRALTSINGVDIKSFDPLTHYGGDIALVSNANAKNGEYIEFVLELRTYQEGSIYWNQVEFTSDLLDSANANWLSDADYRDAKGVTRATGETVSENIINSLRLSLTETGETTAISTYELADGETNVVLGNGTDGVALIQENGAHSHFYAKGNSFVDDNGDAVIQADLATFFTNYINSQIVSSKTSLTADNSNGILVKAVTGDSSTPAIVQVTVRVWIEGWDANAYNAVFGNKFGASLGFHFVATP